MRIFYLIIFIISTTAFIADIVLRYMEKIKGFDLNIKSLKFRSDLVPVEKFFPENLTMLILAIMVGSATGSLYIVAGMTEWYFSLPCAVASGLLICFVIQYFFEGFINAVKKNNLPKGEAAAGLEGYCTQDIPQDDWGRVCLFYKEREFEVNAVCTVERSLEHFDKVVCVYEKDGYYFVARVHDVFKEAYKQL